jgi:hypothetical protein
MELNKFTSLKSIQGSRSLHVIEKANPMLGKYLLKRRESNFGSGFLLGAITGGVLGAASSSGSDGFFSGIGGGLSIALGALVGGVLGGVVGLASGADEKYHIEKLNTEDKRKLLNRLFN